jgi:hypothetical protein
LTHIDELKAESVGVTEALVGVLAKGPLLLAVKSIEIDIEGVLEWVFEEAASGIVKLRL